MLSLQNNNMDTTCNKLKSIKVPLDLNFKKKFKQFKRNHKKFSPKITTKFLQFSINKNLSTTSTMVSWFILQKIFDKTQGWKKKFMQVAMSKIDSLFFKSSSISIVTKQSKCPWITTSTKNGNNSKEIVRSSNKR